VRKSKKNLAAYTLKERASVVRKRNFSFPPKASPLSLPADRTIINACVLRQASERRPRSKQLPGMLSPESTTAVRLCAPNLKNFRIRGHVPPANSHACFACTQPAPGLRGGKRVAQPSEQHNHIPPTSPKTGPIRRERQAQFWIARHHDQCPSSAARSEQSKRTNPTVAAAREAHGSSTTTMLATRGTRTYPVRGRML
jgi:hypothetical protein